MFKYKKSLGQNFLIDKNICQKIINLTKIENQNIIEIGPGKGYLTDYILNKNPKKLFIIEKDNELVNNLIKKYNNIKNIEIFNSDAIYFNYLKIKNPKKIIANLPYNISIKLVTNWLKMNKQFSEIIVMLQKEVANKMDYEKNSKKNRLNTFIEVSSKYKIEFNVSRNVFIPKPKIMSSVVRIIPKNNPKIDLCNFEIFTRKIFKHRRKKLSNVLSHEKKIIKLSSQILEKRAEDLNTKELINIFNQIYNL